MDENGDDVQVLVQTEEHTEEEHNHEEEEQQTEEPSGGEQHCHFHAGVEHCTGGSAEEEANSCGRTDRDYNVPLRVGLLFVILVTSAIGVFTPILATSFTRMTQNSTLFVVLKQFGTGVVISTAFIHLFTHADLMLTNDCIGELQYEGVTAAIFMAGLFLSFLVDYIGARFILWRQNKRSAADNEVRSAQASGESKIDSATPDGNATLTHDDDRGSHVHMHGNADEKIGVMVLEAGILFHSLLIGLTLVVSGDSFFLTLFAVILFHQMFEGIALGACIAQLSPKKASISQKIIMAACFAIITPIGMAIGIGVLNKFNGNDPATLIAIGTLDALSAGILAWVGIVEMLARDWMHGPLLNSSTVRTMIAMTALVAGMILMSVLGKWA